MLRIASIAALVIGTLLVGTADLKMGDSDELALKKGDVEQIIVLKKGTTDLKKGGDLIALKKGTTDLKKGGDLIALKKGTTDLKKGGDLIA